MQYIVLKFFIQPCFLFLGSRCKDDLVPDSKEEAFI